MRTENVIVPMRDGKMGAYVAYPDNKPVGAVIAIMEIRGVNDTMRHHAHEFAEAGFICLVPDLFWRQGRASSFRTESRTTSGRPSISTTISTTTSAFGTWKTRLPT